MAKPASQENLPPHLRLDGQGRVDSGTLADLVEWFLTFDERTARMRHAQVNELFQWKQQDDESHGLGTYPFENAEARFAIGIFQALEENDSEPLLKLWVSDVLNALHESRETKTEMTNSYRLDDDLEASAIQKAEKLTSNAERRLYLTSCWLEALCTAETRVLGWVYQEMYGQPFAP